MPKKINENELVELVSSCPLFASLSKEAVENITKRSTLMKYKTREFIVRKGELPFALMLVVAGEVLEVVIDRNNFTSVAKARYRGEFFSELGIISDMPSDTSVIAQSNASLLAIPKDVFLEIFWSEPAMIKYVIILQSQRLVQSAERSASHTLIRTEGRIAFAILTIESESGKTGTIKVTHDFLAQYCGLARQTVSSVLENWQRQDFLKLKYGQIDILNRDELNKVFMSEANFKT